MNILVLFDGAGLARLGLERAGHSCVGVELDPRKHALGLHVGSGSCVCADAREYFEKHGSNFDAVWASPPCARRASTIKDLTGRGGYREPIYQGDHLQWCLNLPTKVLWVENVTIQGDDDKWNSWGNLFNAAQFLPEPIQNRNRVIGGRYKTPTNWIYHPYKRWFPDVCPCVTATEYKASGATDKCRASRFYGRNLTLEECAYHQGFEVPEMWSHIPEWFMTGEKWREVHWKRNQFEAIGNGVPVYMARAFGRIYT